jgi:hypothetical protein
MIVSDWKRTTTEVPLAGLRPEMVPAIRNHLERYNLGEVLSDTLMTVQTDSEKVRKGLFGGAETVYTGMVITPRWLVWAISGPKTQTAVLSAQLRDIVVQDYAETQFAKMIPDTGIQISGHFTDASDNVSAFLGLDDRTAGRKFKELVIQAAQDAKK